jgi:hypothetical protein
MQTAPKSTAYIEENIVKFPILSQQMNSNQPTAGTDETRPGFKAAAGPLRALNYILLF